MRGIKNSLKLSFSLLAISLLLGSLFFQAYHNFYSNHKHEICVEFDTHIHEKPVDCSLFDYQISLFSFEFFNLDFPSFYENTYEAIFSYSSLFTYLNPTYFSLRGPPVF